MNDYATRLHESLEDNSIPIFGVGRNRDGSVRVDYRPEATLEHRVLAETLIASFDPRPRKPRGLAAIVADINALSATDRARLNTAIAAVFVIEHPRFSRRVLGINIEGDEPE